MINPDYDKEFIFDINAYLIEWYPLMDMATRRTICAMSLEYLTSYDLEDVVDEVVSDYAKEKQNLTKKEEEEEELDEDED